MAVLLEHGGNVLGVFVGMTSCTLDHTQNSNVCPALKPQWGTANGSELLYDEGQLISTIRPAAAYCFWMLTRGQITAPAWTHCHVQLWPELATQIWPSLVCTHATRYFANIGYLIRRTKNEWNSKKRSCKLPPEGWCSATILFIWSSLVICQASQPSLIWHTGTVFSRATEKGMKTIALEWSRN